MQFNSFSWEMMVQQIRWRPCVAEKLGNGDIRVRKGDEQGSRLAALDVAREIFDSLGDGGLWYSAVRVLNK